MKLQTLFTALVSIPLSIFPALCGEPARINAFIIDESLSSTEKTNLFIRFESLACSTNTAQGTKVLIAAFEKGRCRSLVDPITIPTLRYDSPRARKIALNSTFAAVKTAILGIHCGVANEGITLQGIFQFLRDSRCTNSIAVFIAGTPIVKSAKPPIDFESTCPSDGTIVAADDTSQLGLAAFNSSFQRTVLNWWWPGTHPLPLPNERKLTRYLTVACIYTGSELAIITSDLPTALDGFGAADRRAPEHFKLRTEPPGFWPYNIEPLGRLGVPPKLAKALEELRSKGITRALAASWQTPSDVDLIVNCSHQFPGEECTWRSPQTSHLHLLGDLQKATAQEFEIITIDDSVTLDRDLDIKLNLFTSEAQASGHLLLMIGEQLFRMPFQFPPESRGNHGDNPRVDSPHWITIDVAHLLNSPAVAE